MQSNNKMKRMRARAGVMSGLLVLCLGLASGSAPAQTDPEQTTRSTYFEYDPVTGLLTLERIDPGLGTCVEKVYEHDEFGNRKRVETRPCAGTTAAAATFAARVLVNQFDAPGAQAGLEALAPNTHRAGAYTTTTQTIRKSDSQPLSKETAIYDVRFGTVAKQTTVALGDASRSLSKYVEYDGFGRVKKETSPIGTSVAREYFYCKGPKAQPVAAGCIHRVEELTVSYASNRLVDPNTGALSTKAVAMASSAYYVESTPLDANGQPMGAKSRVHYDSLHREIAKETQAYDGTRWTRTITAYDQLGVAAVSWGAHFSDASAVELDKVKQWTPTRDELHRPLEQRHYAQAKPGTVQEVVVRLSYNGLESSVTTPAGADGVERIAITRKNAAGQTVQTVDAYGATLNMAYDAVGQLRQTTDALDNKTTIEYTPGTSRFRTALVDPDLGRWTYEYDALGQLKKQTDAKLQSTELVYDDLGRLIEKRNASLNANWYYDKIPAGSPNAGTWCAAGLNRLCEATAGTSVLRRQRLSYDTKGRPSETTVILDKAYTSRVSYDAVTGATDTLTYPTGFAVKHEYSTVGSGKAPGVLERVVDASNTSRVFWSIRDQAAAQVFDARGNVLKAALGNGVQVDQQFDPISGKAFELRAKTATASGYDIQHNAYEYDKFNNVVRREDKIGSLVDRFTYDRLDRLTSQSFESAADAAATRTVTVGYNAVGSILVKSDVGGYTYGASGGAQPHAVRSVGGSSYYYDANGSLERTTGVQVREHRWSAFNQPERMSYGGNVVEFLYDAEYKRVQETVTKGGTVRTTWMIHPNNAGGLGFEREEIRVGGTLTRNESRHYISVGGAAIAVVKTLGGSGTVPSDPSLTNYWHKDALGSIVVVTDANGAVNGQRMAFDAWGRRIRPSGLNDQNINPAHGDRGFTGHEHLDELALVHMNGRIYDPFIARFLSADPIVASAEALQHYDRYSYVYNNPLAYTDPDGNCPWCAGFALVAGTAMMMEGNKYWRVVGTIMVAWALGGNSGMLVTEAGLTPVAAQGLAGAYIGFVNSGGTVEGTVSGGVFAAVTAGIGQAGLDSVGKVLAHAMVGCAQGAMSGGACGPSAMAGAFGKATTLATDSWGIGIDQFAATTIAGGTASVIGGGKFANGALQAALGYIFNHLSSYSTDVPPSRAVQLARILAEGDVADFRPIRKEFVAYYDYDEHGRKVFMQTEIKGKTIDLTSVEYTYKTRNGGFLVVQDHHLGHNNPEKLGPHMNAKVLAPDGTKVRDLIINNNSHFHYIPTHAYQNSTIRYKGTNQIRPSTISIMRASGWQF